MLCLFRVWRVVGVVLSLALGGLNYGSVSVVYISCSNLCQLQLW